MSLSSLVFTHAAQHQGPAGPRAPADADSATRVPQKPTHPRSRRSPVLLGGKRCGRTGKATRAVPVSGHSPARGETDITPVQLFPLTPQPTLSTLNPPTERWHGDAGRGCHHRGLARRGEKPPPGENIIKKGDIPSLGQRSAQERDLSALAQLSHTPERCLLRYPSVL